MKKIILFVMILISIVVEVFPQVMVLRRSLRYYNFEPITGLAITTPDGILIENEYTQTRVIKSDSSTKRGISGWTWVQRYEHNKTDLSDSTLVADSSNSLSRTFDVSMYPYGSEFLYRYSLFQANITGTIEFKQDTVVTYRVEELANSPLYSADGYPLFDANGILLYPSIE